MENQDTGIKTYSYYNNEVKKEWLEQFSPNTQVVYGRIFDNSMEMESELQKDLYNFDINELKSLFHSLRPLSPKISKDNGAVVRKYIQWAIEKGYKKGFANPIEYNDGTWYEQFIDENVEIFFTKKKIDRICNWLRNSQDEVIVRLIFDGVWGIGGSEIVNLKKTDFDPNADNLLILTDNEGNNRNIHVSNECIEAIESAIDERTYLLRNGFYEEGSNRNEYELVVNNYVVRNSITRTYGLLEPAHSHVIYRRLDTIKEEFPLEHFSPKAIQRSGMLYMATQLMGGGELKFEHLETIAKKYNYNFDNVVALREFINEENIAKVYGEEE